MVDVAYIVSHGFAARMVMQTNLLGKLVEKGQSVALISPDKEDINLKEYCSRAGVKLHQFDRRSSFWSAQYSETRMYFLENINKNTALLEKYKYNTENNNPIRLKTKLKYLGLKTIHDLKEVFPFIKSWYKNREAKHLQSREAYQFLEDLNPRIVVSTYPVDFREAMLLNSCRKAGIKTVLHLLSWDNITCKGHFPALADEYIAWGPIMREELVEYYDIQLERIHTCGVPHFDVHVESRGSDQFASYIRNLGLDCNKPYMFFGMSSPRFAPYEIEIVEWLAEKVENEVFGKDMQLVIRPHPQNMQGGMADPSWLPRIEKLNTKLTTSIDYPDLSSSKMKWSMRKNDMVKLSRILAGAALSFNSGSTLSIDSLMCGTPVILTTFDANRNLEYWKSAQRLVDYNHLKKLLSYKGVVSVSSFSELLTVAKLFLKNNEYLVAERKITLEAECGQDGDSTERVIDAILSIVRNTEAAL